MNVETKKVRKMIEVEERTFNFTEKEAHLVKKVIGRLAFRDFNELNKEDEFFQDKSNYKLLEIIYQELDDSNIGD